MSKFMRFDLSQSKKFSGQNDHLGNIDRRFDWLFSLFCRCEYHANCPCNHYSKACPCEDKLYENRVPCSCNVKAYQCYPGCKLCVFYEDNLVQQKLYEEWHHNKGICKCTSEGICHHF